MKDKKRVEKALILAFKNTLREDCWKNKEEYEFVYKIVKFIKEREGLNALQS